MLIISTGADRPVSLSHRSLISSENINGTKLARLGTNGNSKSLANSYPKPLPPRVGIDSAPVATIRDLQLSNVLSEDVLLLKIEVTSYKVLSPSSCSFSTFSVSTSI